MGPGDTDRYAVGYIGRRDASGREAAPAKPGSEPPGSAVAAFMQHLEVAQWAEGADPEAAVRVINRLLFGTPYPRPRAR